jgi:hypothetical protein
VVAKCRNPRGGPARQAQEGWAAAPCTLLLLLLLLLLLSAGRARPWLLERGVWFSAEG